MKLICGCLLAVALFGCLADAQYSQTEQHLRPQVPQQPQQPLNPQQPQQPKNPQQPKEIFHSCEVAEQYKIHCGAPGISPGECETINCCFDGRTCYYGKHGE